MEGYKRIEDLTLGILFDLSLKGFDAFTCQRLRIEIEEVKSLKKIIEEEVYDAEMILSQLITQQQFD